MWGENAEDDDGSDVQNRGLSTSMAQHALDGGTAAPEDGGAAWSGGPLMGAVGSGAEGRHRDESPKLLLEHALSGHHQGVHPPQVYPGRIRRLIPKRGEEPGWGFIYSDLDCADLLFEEDTNEEHLVEGDLVLFEHGYHEADGRIACHVRKTDTAQLQEVLRNLKPVYENHTDHLKHVANALASGDVNMARSANQWHPYQHGHKHAASMPSGASSCRKPEDNGRSAAVFQPPPPPPLPPGQHNGLGFQPHVSRVLQLDGQTQNMMPQGMSMQPQLGGASSQGLHPMRTFHPNAAATFSGLSTETTTYPTTYAHPQQHPRMQIANQEVVATEGAGYPVYTAPQQTAPQTLSTALPPGPTGGQQTPLTCGPVAQSQAPNSPVRLLLERPPMLSNHNTEGVISAICNHREWRQPARTFRSPSLGVATKRAQEFTTLMKQLVKQAELNLQAEEAQEQGLREWDESGQPWGMWNTQPMTPADSGGHRLAGCGGQMALATTPAGHDATGGPYVNSNPMPSSIPHMIVDMGGQHNLFATSASL